MKTEDKVKKRIKTDSRLVRIFLAEFLGTFVLAFVVIGANLFCAKRDEVCSSIHGGLAGGLGAGLEIYPA